MSSNLAGILTDTVAEHGDRPALKLDDTVVTYEMLDEGSARVAALLADKGVEPGDRVGIMLPNVPYFGVIYYGILRAGGVVVPMNPLLKGREVKFYLEDPGAKVMFAWGDFEEAASKGAEDAGADLVLVKPGEFEEMLADIEPDKELADRDGDDTAVMLYTSGTTGTPKGAELTHDNLRKNCELSARTLAEATRGGRAARRAAAVPLLRADLRAQRRRVRRRLPVDDPALRPRQGAGDHRSATRSRSSRACRRCTTRCSTARAPATPTSSSLRACMSGGAAMPVEVMKEFEKTFGCEVLEGYGLSETSPVASFNHPGQERKPGSIGTPIEGVEMKVVDDDGKDVEGTGEEAVGEIAIKGHNIMKGYWNNDEATKEVLDDDGWFRTGDMAYVDDDGYFFIVDRKKDMIIRGGYNVYPREIEEVLYEHPAVSEAAVIGIPDDSRARRSAPRSSSRRARRSTPTSCATTSRSASPTTSTRARSGSRTSCPRARPARSSSARSRSRRR